MAKRKISGWLIAIVAVVALVIWGVGINNRLVSQQEKVSKAWGNVETQYQRRADLIPNLVSTVQGAEIGRASCRERV